MQNSQPKTADRVVELPRKELTPPPMHKNPLYAALLSAMPGMGNIYNGLYMRGIAFFLSAACLMAIAERNEQFVFPTMFLWIFNIIDAVRQATLINHGYVEDGAAAAVSARRQKTESHLLSGLLLFVIGLVGLLHQFFDISLEWLLDFWPLVLMGIGAWLVLGWYRDRRDEDEGGDEELFETRDPQA